MSKNTKPVNLEAKIKRLQKSLDCYKNQVEDCKRIMRRQQSVIEAEQKWRLDFKKLIGTVNTEYLAQY